MYHDNTKNMLPTTDNVMQTAILACPYIFSPVKYLTLLSPNGAYWENYKLLKAVTRQGSGITLNFLKFIGFGCWIPFGNVVSGLFFHAVAWYITYSNYKKHNPFG